MPRPRPSRRFRLNLEGLEDRNLLSSTSIVGSYYADLLGRVGSAAEL